MKIMIQNKNNTYGKNKIWQTINILVLVYFRKDEKKIKGKSTKNKTQKQNPKTKNKNKKQQQQQKTTSKYTCGPLL